MTSKDYSHEKVFGAEVKGHASLYKKKQKQDKNSKEKPQSREGHHEDKMWVSSA